MMKRKIIKETLSCWLLTVLLVLIGFATHAFAGDLEPSAPPGPTMKTLSEIEPRTPVNNLRGSFDFTYRHIIVLPGSYYFSGNITTTTNGIFVAVDNVTIDMMGYTLTGPGQTSGNYTGISMAGRSNVEIRNGTIKDFGSHGIYESTGTGKAHRIISVRSLSIGTYGILLLGSNHLVKDCTVAETLAGGIRTIDECKVTGNTVYNNQGDGILVGISCIVSGNTVYKSQEEGISAGFGSTITGNAVYDNQENGILAGWGCNVTANTVYNNKGDGISAGSGCIVTSNAVYNHPAAGIRAGDGCTVTKNTASFNQYRGILVGDGCTITGNTAFRNYYGFHVGSGSTVTGNTAFNNQFTGFTVGSNSIVTGNTANRNNSEDGLFEAGITILSETLVKNNIASGNLLINIQVFGSDSVFEENLVTNSGQGIYFGLPGNFYANNRAANNHTNYSGFVPTGFGDGGGNVEF